MLRKYRRAVETLAAGSMDWVHRFNPRWHVALAVHVKCMSLAKESRISIAGVIAAYAQAILAYG